MPLATIVSGGQTGVDRGALDAALQMGFPCGGFCPPGRLAEDGVIPIAYPLSELPEGGNLERTLRNIQESDGTAILYFGALEGGTEQTVLHCIVQQCPYKLVDALEVTVERAVDLLGTFVRQHAIRTLNVAGPRLSRQPRAHDYAFRVVSGLLRQHGFGQGGSPY
jgi:hypothetical protein